MLVQNGMSIVGHFYKEAQSGWQQKRQMKKISWGVPFCRSKAKQEKVK